MRILSAESSKVLHSLRSGTIGMIAQKPLWGLNEVSYGGSRCPHLKRPSWYELMYY